MKLQDSEIPCKRKQKPVKILIPVNDFHALHIQSREEAQNAPTQFTTFSLFYNGEFVTHEILSEKKFEKILDSKGL